MANLAPQTEKTTGAWNRDEVRELNNALHIALEYFNIPKGGDKWAAKAIAKRARAWSVRWASTFYFSFLYITPSVLLTPLLLRLHVTKKSHSSAMHTRRPVTLVMYRICLGS